YQPEKLFDAKGRLQPALAALPPKDDKRMSANPHANGGQLYQPLQLPDFREYAVAVEAPGVTTAESTMQLGKFLRDVFTLNEAQQNFRLFCPDETHSNRLQAVFEATSRCFMEPILGTDDHLSPDGRVMEVL